MKKLGLHSTRIDLGEVDIREDLSTEQMILLREALSKTGLELMDDKKSILAEQIKAAIIELVHFSDEELQINHSDYLSEKLNHNYPSLASIFSEVNGTTIEKFYLAQKIEKVKEMLVCDQFSLTEIAYKLQYSSVAHLSNQFRKMTGLTPSHFKILKSKTKSAPEPGQIA
jgi:AraC-like DNA-binding protein